jgi:hypothetical protein
MSGLDPAEAVVLNQIKVRLVQPEEQTRWDQLISQHHYLKNANLVGERLCYVVEYQGRWLALLGWSAAAYHIRARDQWIGWNDNQRRARLPLVANNARFVLSEPGQYPNLATELALNTARLSEDWLKLRTSDRFGRSFVDTQLFRGTCKAAGWQAVGYSWFQAWRRFLRGARPTSNFIFELIKHAGRKLRQRHLPTPRYEQKIEPSCQMPTDQLHSSGCVAAPGARKPQGKGLRHKQATADHYLCLLLSGVREATAPWPPLPRPDSPNERLCAVGSTAGRTYDTPTENCIYRVLKAVPVLEFNRPPPQQARHGAHAANGGADARYAVAGARNWPSSQRPEWTHFGRAGRSDKAMRFCRPNAAGALELDGTIV